ncbi:tigger transposable element-derived protein 1-like [Hermetia illucens]|uniref:tigger transposable element-derived protein 1-like n=1 Tax=Hermetia illucens TaxID=343691 RepID=UPI0018CC0E0A|nr:tigger transposable element-derived protein 1-like [Hermetia illucens]
MDQGVIATFKAYYLRRIFRQLVERLDDIIALDIEASWKEATSGTMNKSWRKIWSKAVEPLSGIDIDSDSEINREILEIAETIGFDVIDEKDIFDIINTPEVPLSNEELLNIVKDDIELVQQNLDEWKKVSNQKNLQILGRH